MSPNKPKKETVCPKLKVHEEEMETSDREKYLGDIFNKNGSPKMNIEERRHKGYGIVSEILAILSEVPLGSHKIEIGLMLRQAMLINGILFNSEVWHAVTEEDIKGLEKVDEHLLRSIVNGHAKTPLEFIYLETGALPIRFIIASRRMMYLQTILKRPDNELIKRIFKAQAEEPCQGDFVKLIETDFATINENLNQVVIQNLPTEVYKKRIKAKVRLAAFSYLTEIQKTHSKVKNIKYDKLEPQPYLLSTLFTNDDVNLLYSLRSRGINCKANFRGMYGDDLACPVCDTEALDDQQHILHCTILAQNLPTEELAKHKTKYEDIFADCSRQKEVTELFSKLLKIREDILNKEE